MRLGKKVAISNGNGAEIWPLGKGRKSPDACLKMNRSICFLSTYYPAHESEVPSVMPSKERSGESVHMYLFL